MELNDGNIGAMVPTGQRDSSTALTPANAMERMGFGPSKSTYITTVDESTPNGRQQVFSLMQTAGGNLDDRFNTTIEVTDFIVFPIELVNEESGETVRLPLTRMLLSDGAIVQTTGRGVADVLLMYCDRVRRAPWHNPPAKFVPRKQTTRGKRQFYTLEPIFDNTNPDKPSKK